MHCSRRKPDHEITRAFPFLVLLSLAATSLLGAGFFLAGCGDDSPEAPPGDTVCTTTLVRPSNGQLFVVGGTITIDWATTGSCGDYVRIDLLRNGQVCATITDSTANDGQHAWIAAQCDAESQGYRIRLTDPAAASSVEGEGSFTISSEPLTTADHYVAPDGNDDHAGTEAAPWLTIQKAASTLAAGDTVYIRAGTYNEHVVPANSGSPGNDIVYAAYPGDVVTLDGRGVTLPTEAGLFEISGVSHIRVTGLRIIEVGPHDNDVGILVYNSSHITIDHNYTYNTVSSGIGVWNSANVILDGNEVELACNDGEQECITVGGTDQFEVRNNHVHDGGPGTRGGEGIDLKDGSSNGKVFGNLVHHVVRVGIYVDAWDKHTHDIDVYGNVAHDMIGGDGFSVGSESGGLLENVTLYNNIAYDNDLNGISIHRCCDENTPAHPLRNIRIINNTCYANGNVSWGGGITSENPEAADVLIRNNICSQNVFYQILDEAHGANFTVDHNLIDGYRSYADEIRGTDFVEGDPLFTNSTGHDFHLQASSPAANQGSAVEAPNDDHDGNPRPQGGGVDIGAYEGP